ncbi:MAG: NTP transferase domain-containing protein [Actinobacteria bacterium]|nr:NTP transferase domain-containing protein [Actinomycetota bacterium]MBI3687851.1 NTP transferase domain-containing protein [Actinomycetota bacterium]
MRYGVIMAGGAGTRLWPMSRAARPKQLLEVVGGRSLLQLAFERLRAVLPADRIYVCTAQAHRDAVLGNLPDLPPDNLIGEPCGRDTANAVGLPAAVLHRRDPDAVTAFVSADHVIDPVEVFADRLEAAFGLAEKAEDALVTLGIVPTEPHTGYGYIERGDPLPEAGYRVAAFREKPDAATARSYLGTGRHYWNSGMFVWRAATVLAELATHLPAAYAGLTRIAAAWDGPERAGVLASVYPTLPKISIDYAVIEPASQGLGGAAVLVVELPVRWLDIGSWPALASTVAGDDGGNVSQGRAVLVDCADNIIISDDADHLMAAVGLRDMIIVHTRDATMVCPKSAAEQVKRLVGEVGAAHGARYL